MKKTKDFALYAAIGLDSYKIWISNKDKAICNQCHKVFVGSHQHKIKSNRAIANYLRGKSDFKK